MLPFASTQAERLRQTQLASLSKLKWLEQLLRAIDDLNLKYGIQHQDVAPRKLLIDPEADNLVIFDSNWAADRVPASTIKVCTVLGSKKRRERSNLHTSRDHHERRTFQEDLLGNSEA